MREIPILFSTPMVQALLAGRKTQTRRIVKDHPAIIYNWGEDEGIESLYHEFKQYMSEDDGKMHGPEWLLLNGDGDVECVLGKCRYGVSGDVLWVRESCILNNTTLGKVVHCYKADTPNIPRLHGMKWKPSIHMPKSVSRIWLANEYVDIERLHDITEEDAIAEGVLYHDCEVLGRRYKDYESDASGYGDPNHDFPTVSTARESYFTLWRSIHGVESFEQNPFVWAVGLRTLSTTGKPQL